MSINFKAPEMDADGFFNIYEGARVFDGDMYLVRTKGPTPIKAASCTIDESAYFTDANDEEVEDVEWVKPFNETDRIGLGINATRDDIQRMLETLTAWATPVEQEG